jgi:hypothetical protein
MKVLGVAGLELGRLDISGEWVLSPGFLAFAKRRVSELKIGYLLKAEG